MYSPGVQFDPGIIERGFARSGAAIAGAIQDYGALKKQDKAAKALFDALEPEEDAATGALKPHPLGLTKDAFNSMSAQDRIAKISGFVEAEALKSARRKEQMAGEEMALRKNESAARLAALTREQGADDALASVMANSGGSVPALETPGMFGGAVAPAGRFGQPTPESILRAVAENPQAVNARGFSNVDNIVRAMQEGGQENLSPNWIEDPVSGMRFMGRGRTTLPSGMNPTVASKSVPEVPGYTAAPTGRGGYTWLKTPDGKVDINQNIKLLQLQQEMVSKDYNLNLDQRTAKLAEINDAIDALRHGDNEAQPSPPKSSAAAPKKGDVLKGYRFKGGDPADKNNWEKVK